MGDEVTAGPESVGALRKRRETMADGRYLIYFTFDDGGGEPDDEEPVRPDPEAAPEAVEESRV